MNTNFEYIVESAWLAEHLDDPNVVVLDTTTHLLPRQDKPYDIVSGRSDFEAAHIPGAQFVDLDMELSDPNQPAHLRFMLPSMQVFAQVMSRLGITNQTHVVCYATANHWWATRMWWMLRVFGHDKASVLNGGFQKWSREGRAIAVGQSKPRAASSFEPAFRAELVANKADVFAAIDDQGICTINALRPEQHRGEPGGSNYGRPGHIAGSVNIAAIHIVDENNVFKPLHELRTMFAQALASDRVITYCGGGIAASSDALILTILGHPDVRIYDASLSEWARDKSLPMETGDRIMTIAIDDPAKPDVYALLQEHLQSMFALSPPESVHALDVSALKQDGISFWTIRDGSQLLGCGALKTLSAEHGEIKSMRTATNYRRRGAGRALLVHIIHEAKSRGFIRLSLETGTAQSFIPAQRLYASAGFLECGPFGDYKVDPHSLFMTLDLSS